jgi:hypothetical protein
VKILGLTYWEASKKSSELTAPVLTSTYNVTVFTIYVALQETGSGCGFALASTTTSADLVAVVAIGITDEDASSRLRCTLLAACADLMAVVAVDVTDEDAAVGGG